MSVSNQDQLTTVSSIHSGVASPELQVKNRVVSCDIQKELHEFELSLATHDTTHETPHTLFAPMHYEPGYAYPLIVWLHGNGTAGERQLMKIMPIISMRNYVAVAPQGICSEETSPVVLPRCETVRSSVLAQNRSFTLDNAFNKNRSPEKKQSQYHWPDSETGFNIAQQRVFDGIRIAAEKCNIAKHRIFLAGFGDGGTMAFRVAMQFPKYFAGVASLCGPFPQGKLPLCRLQTVRSMPCLMSVGRDSNTFSPTDAAKQMSLFHTAGMSVTVRQYPCRQELSTQMLEDVNRWIMEKM
ncbi:MAG: hypothetical protein FWC50_08635 [Planctomycetaceae bacterium]|nr:hypothetical protein [Planctomycetaceae bacterium]